MQKIYNTKHQRTSIKKIKYYLEERNIIKRVGVKPIWMEEKKYIIILIKSNKPYTIQLLVVSEREKNIMSKHIINDTYVCEWALE